MTDTDRDIEAIRAALEAGPTPGKWTTDRANPNLVCVDSMPYEYIAEVAPSEFSDSAHNYKQECANAAYIAACHPERIARLLAALEAATKDAARYRWIRQVAEGEADNGEHCSLIKLYGLQGAEEDAFLLSAPHLTDAIDAAMKATP